MLFSQDITISANTAEADKTATKIKVTDGIIHKVSIVFPAGCAGLVKVQMFDAGHQFISSTEGQFLSGDSEVVNIPDFYEIKDAPRYITVKAWNDDATYDHTIQVRIYILPKKYLLPAGATEGYVAALRSLFVNEDMIRSKFERELEQAGG